MAIVSMHGVLTAKKCPLPVVMLKSQVMSASFRGGSYRSYVWQIIYMLSRVELYEDVYSLLVRGASVIGNKFETDSITTMPISLLYCNVRTACYVYCVLTLQFFVCKHSVSLSYATFLFRKC